MNTQREGFTLTEVLISVVIMGVVLTSLAGMTYTTARQAVVADHAAARQALALQTLNRFTTLPYANLVAAAGCDTVGTANRRFARCVTATPSGSSTVIEIVTTPLQHNVPASTMRLIRSAPPVSNPLCIGC